MKRSEKALLIRIASLGSFLELCNHPGLERKAKQELRDLVNEAKALGFRPSDILGQRARALIGISRVSPWDAKHGSSEIKLALRPLIVRSGTNRAKRKKILDRINRNRRVAK